MGLPTLPKKSPKSRTVTFRTSEVTFSNLKKLQKMHNLSQGLVLEILINDEVARREKAESHQQAAKKTS
jgi:hypothetical protein